MSDLSMLSKERYHGQFQVYRMLPQSTILYFYSHKGIPFVDKKAPRVKIDERIKNDINAKFIDAFTKLEEKFE